MEKLIFAQENGRELSFLDKIFGISAKANEMASAVGKDKVINATIGALLDDSGKLIVFDAVTEAFKKLSPEEVAPYAPIRGLSEFNDVIKKYAFGTHAPKMYTEAVVTPGGAGALRIALANYSKIGDVVLTSDWYWAPYKNIATEMNRKLMTYRIFDDKGDFNFAAFEEKVSELLKVQDLLAIIINTPAHNPTGYSLSNSDWDMVLGILKKYAVGGKSVALIVDAAYIDFAGDPEKYREFIPKFESVPDSILPMMAYSASKTFTAYGVRCGALICMTNNKDMCEEFKNICAFSCRATWSNCNRSGQQLLVNIYNDGVLRERLEQERTQSRDMLIRRGKVFESKAKECGLTMVPFDAGFFASIPCQDPDAVGELLQKEGLFLVPLAMGLRVSLAAITEKQCEFIPAMIKKAMDEYYSHK